MLYNAKEGKLHIGEVSFDYIQFGTGKKTLLMIHGLNTNGIKGAAFSLAYMYENLGHAAYEEAADFNQRVLNFLKK